MPKFLFLYWILFGIVSSITESEASFYALSDLGISSDGDLFVSFFNRVQDTGQPASPQTTPYASAIIFSRQPKIGQHALIPHEDFFYRPLHNDCSYLNIEEILSDYHTNSTKKAITLPDGRAQQVSQDSLIKKIQEANTIFISFGAGLSAGYIPTLGEFYDHLEIKRSPVNISSATSESLRAFLEKLIDNCDPLLLKVRMEWSKVGERKIKTTPAHQALKEAIDILKHQGKKVYVYSENLDGIDDEVGIKLDDDNLHPSIHNDEKVVALACGQAVDFAAIFGTLYSRTRSNPSPASFFSLNIVDQPILIYPIDAVANSLSANEIQELSLQPLEMGWIPGSLQETLPALLEKLKHTSQ